MLTSTDKLSFFPNMIIIQLGHLESNDSNIFHSWRVKKNLNSLIQTTKIHWNYSNYNWINSFGIIAIQCYYSMDWIGTSYNWILNRFWSLSIGKETAKLKEQKELDEIDNNHALIRKFQDIINFWTLNKKVLSGP